MKYLYDLEYHKDQEYCWELIVLAYPKRSLMDLLTGYHPKPYEWVYVAKIHGIIWWWTPSMERAPHFIASQGEQMVEAYHYQSELDRRIRAGGS